MAMKIFVKNVKCNGCVNNIRNKLSDDPRIKSVEVKIEGGEVTLDADESIRAEIVETLSALGYPEAS